MQNLRVANKEKRYKVTGRIIADYEIIVQALDADEARYFASDIDLDRWHEVTTDWQITEVQRNYHLNVVTDKELPTPKNVGNPE